MKKIVFVTGTRADYGKIKSIMKKLSASLKFQIYIYVTGMHLLEEYGNTYLEIEKDNFKNIFLAKPIDNTHSMDEILALNVLQMSKYVKKICPDMIFIHGDRVEAMAGAIVGCMNNIYVSHIEGGEISGTIDESIRHAISKLANYHFVANDSARKVLIQMGEDSRNIYIVGSPDIDIMMRNNFSINDVKKRYDIPFDNFSILIYHPVTTEIENLKKNIEEVITAAIMSKKNYIVIYPNNDLGTDIIKNEFKRLYGNKNFKIFPSIRFEYFLTLLKHADFVLGNSSLGIRETGIYGIPTINVGTRQDGRFNLNVQKNICLCKEDANEILDIMKNIDNYRYKCNCFGDGHSDEKIYNILIKDDIWNKKLQKKFFNIF